MSFIRPATNIARTHLLRPLSTTSRQFSLSKPVLTQGHATKKARDPIHKDKDVQSASVRGGEQSKTQAKSNPADQGESEPFDAARQGSAGGEAKSQSAEGTGSFKDQVGGQGAGGVKKGAKEDASGESYTDMAKNALSGNFGKGAKRDFSTSARRSVEPASDAGAKSREPKNKVESEGDQSGHLKHKSPEKPDSGKGNAAPEPHLPSKQAQAGKGQTRGMATKPPGGYSKTFKESDNEGVPPEPLPATLKSAYAPEATAKPDADLTPSHEAGHSSTSVDPPHPVLTQQAKEGTLADRNGPPEPEMGEMGNKEAWKHRK